MYAVIAFRRRREPRSIFEHIDAHIRPGSDRLAEGGEVLPDEPPAAAVAGDDEVAIDRIYAALAALAAKPGAATRRRLRELFREGNVRGRIDGLRDRLSAESPPDAVNLYPELREILLTSGYRDEVKYAMALLAGFGRREDADLFRVLGRHEEFTLYAAVALAGVSDDPVEEWLDLLPHVAGWGRTEVSELILREPRSEIVRERLLRTGLGVGNALTLAIGCRLEEFLARAELDDELLARAREIIDALIWEWDSPFVLTDYPEAGPAVEGLVRHLGLHRPSLAGFLTVFDLRRVLIASDDLEACGFDADRLGRVVGACSAAIDGGSWVEQIDAARASDLAHERRLAEEAATRLGIA
jgi:hypothetical protein